MKNTAIFTVLLLLVTLVGCGNPEKDRAEAEKIRQDSIKTADSVSMAEKNREIQAKRAERKKALEKGDTFTTEAAEAMLQEKIKDGKVFMLSDDGETIPFKFEGGKIMAVSMPDGKLYQVEKDGDKTMLLIPGGGKMERRVIDGKIYLVNDDDQTFEVKVINKKLVAVLDDGSEVNLARK